MGSAPSTMDQPVAAAPERIIAVPGFVRPLLLIANFTAQAVPLWMMYSTGQGGAPVDLVSAHMMFNLAAMRGSEEAKRYRRELSSEMDRDDVNEAQRAAREWLAGAA